VYHPLWGPLIIFEVAANLVQFIFTLWVAWIFFKKSNQTPKFYIIWLVLLALVQIADALLVKQIPMAAAQSADPEIIRDIARSIIGAVVWIPYFLVSKRVKNTFINSAS
jgi:H+/Cl- antiporter ClcA